MPAVPHPALVPRLPSPGVRRLPPPLASRAPAVVRALRPTGAAVRALPPEARLANVAGAFAMRNAKCGMGNESQPGNSAFRIPHAALERPLVLVDDVFTTGATLAEAARALERAGARTVLAVTFGRALVPDFT